MKNKTWFPWNGSKRWLLSELNPILHRWNGGGKFIDPFAGSCAVAISAKSLFPNSQQIVADTSKWLTAAYQSQFYPCAVASNFEEIEYWRNLNDDDFEELSINERANRFAICLFTAWGNRWETLKDGTFRSTVNLKYCESSFLEKRLSDFFMYKHFSEHDQVLCADWAETVKLAKAGDMVYLDSPYPESLGYGNNYWSFSDHLDVVDWIEHAIKNNINVVASNMLTVERLYKRIGMNTLSVVGPKPSKTKAARQEVIAYKFND